jgi:hypothetical protein
MGLMDYILPNRRIRELEGKVRELQRMRDVYLAGGVETIAADDGTNPYTTKEAQVAEIIRKFHGIADYGNQFVQRIIAVKTSFVMPKGVGLAVEDAAADPAEAEMEFLEQFLDYNDLNQELALDLLKEKEIEDGILVRLDWNLADSQVEIRYVSWSDTRYALTPAVAGDYRYIGSASWTYEDRQVTLPWEQFVYTAFNRRANSFTGYPGLGSVLRECEDADKILRDWRKISHLFAKQTPYFKCKDRQEVDATTAAISDSGWKIGQSLVGTAEFSLVYPEGITVDLLMQELLNKVKMISGATGVSVHFLGFPDVMSNRATADAMQAPVEVVSQGELGRWLGFYEELFDKAIVMRNRYLGPPLRPGLVKPQIVRYTPQQMTDAKDVWIPAFEKNLVSRREARAKLPDIQVDDEAAFAEIAEREEAARNTAATRSLFAEPPPAENQPGGQEE